MENDYLSYQNTKCIKGICACSILFHHLFQYGSLFENNIILSFIFQNMGWWFVSLFFFFSGYGLMISYIRKGKNYILKMPRNRILPFYLMCIIMMLIYILFYYLIGDYDKISILMIIKTLTFGNTIIMLGWYLQTLLVFYLIFYFIYKYIDKEKTKEILLLFGWGLYCCICFFMNLLITWYVSSFCFLLGIIWAKNKNNIDKFLKSNKKNLLLICIMLCLFVSSLLCTKVMSNKNIIFLLRVCSNILFSIMVMFIIMYINRFRIRKIFFNKFTTYLGNISLEIYVSQGLFLLLFKNKVIINNRYVYCIIVTLCTFIFANLINKLIKKMNFIVRGEKNNEEIKIRTIC